MSTQIEKKEEWIDEFENKFAWSKGSLGQFPEIKKFIKDLLTKQKKMIRDDLHDILWNKDGSLKSHDASYIVSSVMHYFITPSLTIKEDE